MDPQNFNYCHWFKSNSSSKKTIIKLFKRKDADKIHEVKKGLKPLKFESMATNNPIFINDSLCEYYKKLRPKWKWAWMNKFIHGFFASYELIEMKVFEISNLYNITHLVDLEIMFPKNP